MKSIIVMVIVAIVAVLIFKTGKTWYLKPGLVNGEKASDFTGELPDGSSFQLSDLKGNYVLLNFWGSWCGPCRGEHPQLVMLHKEFKGKSFSDASGFEIVSIGIEENEASWSRAIQLDSLNWKYHHLEQSMFEGPIAKAFNVRQLPTKFLLNPDGVIIAVDPSLDKVAGILKERIQTSDTQ
ncbi:MAG: TlpA disulfide reductase family protein [Saprospiraceae bacterium]